MNFQGLGKVESPKQYLDVAFGRASKRAAELKNTKKEHDRLKKAKMLDTERLEVIRQNLNTSLNRILTSFPSIDSLDVFYLELMKCTLDLKSMRKCLGSIKWCVDKVNSFTKEYKGKILRASDVTRVNRARKEYYGRISSLLKQMKRFLEYLEDARKTMKRYPAVKTGIFTVCIFGFPNVGKSTLLSKLTDSTPEINSYAFTTKNLNVGYIKTPLYKVQFVDTPGTLNRFGKMNNVELQAYLAVKHLADMIIYVFDPTDTYPFGDQIKLLKTIDAYEKPYVLFMSKTDVADEESVDEIKKRFPEILTDLEELRSKVIKEARSKKTVD